MKKVWNIAVKELKNYFVSPVAYIVIAVFLVASGWFFFSTFFIYNQASMRKFFEILPYILALVIPAITMGLFSEEKNAGTIETLKTLPYTDLEIVSGKFLGSFLFTVIMLIPTVTYSFWIAYLGDVDTGAVLGGYVGALLLSALFVSIGIFASSLTKNQVISFIISALIGYFLILIKTFLVLVPEKAVSFFRILSVTYHFDNFAKGIVDSKDIVYFVSLSVLFLIGALETIKEKDTLKERKILASSSIRLIVYILLVLVVNAAENASSTFRIDLTQNRIYSLSKLSKQSVSNLVEPLTVKVFFSKNLPAPYNGIEQYLRDLLEEYAVYGGKKFNYQFYDLSSGEGEVSAKVRENEELAESFGISPVQIQVVEHDEIKFKKAYMGLVLICGDLVEKIPAITSTGGIEYKITSKIEKINNKINKFLSLKDDIKITLYLSESLKENGSKMGIGDLKQLESVVEKAVDSLNKQNYGKLAFETIVPEKAGVNTNELEKKGVLKLKWNAFVSPSGKVPAGEGFIGLTVSYGKETETVPVLSVINIPLFGAQYKIASLSDIENGLSSAIDSVLNLNEKIGYVISNGAVTPFGFGVAKGESASNFFNLLNENYKVKTIDLKEGDLNEVNALIIPGIKEKLSDYELYRIDQFVMKGKPVMFLVDTFAEQNNNRMGIPSAQPIDTGIDKLLLKYGVEVSKSIVMDTNCFKQKMPQTLGGGEQKIYFAPVIKNQNINHKLPFLKNIKGFVVLMNSPVKAESKKEEKTKYSVLYTSSEKSWVQTGFITLNPMFIQPPAGKNFQKYPLAVAVEGKLESYFKNKPIPEKPSENKDKNKSKKTSSLKSLKAEGVKREYTDKAKILVFGTSAIIKNSFVDSEGSAPNAMLALNSVDYLTGRLDLAELRSKAQFYNPLRETSANLRSLIKWFNIAGLPIIVVLIGVLMWVMRKRRMKRIREMFA